MITETYKVGVNGAIDESKSFDDAEKAKAKAFQLWEDFSGDGEPDATCQAAVYGFAEYSDDDKTPEHARTTFWRHWYVDELGRIHPDGR